MKVRATFEVEGLQEKIKEVIGDRDKAQLEVDSGLSRSTIYNLLGGRYEAVDLETLMDLDKACGSELVKFAIASLIDDRAAATGEDVS